MRRALWSGRATHQQEGVAVAEETSKSPGPFDVRTVKSLVSLMTQHDLSEIDLRDGTVRLRLRRGNQQVAVAAHPPFAAAPMPAASPAAAPRNDSPAAVPAAPTKPLLEIKSPTVGTFYAKPKP